MLQAAVFTRSPDSSESRPLKVRETMMMKGVAVLTVSWATAGETMDKEGAGRPQRPQTLEGRMPTNERRMLNVRSDGFLTTTPIHYSTKLF